jgi:predicted nucleic acid-binding protein
LSLLPENPENTFKRNQVTNILSLHQDNIYISTQFINEISNVLNKKQVLSKENTIDFLNLILSVANCIPLTQDLTFNAIEIKHRYGFSFYDCLIIASALSIQCDILVTEDLQHLQVIVFNSSQLQIFNPFI